MSETLRAAPAVEEVPKGKSGPANVFGSTAWRLGPIISDYPLKDLGLYTPRWVWPPSFKHTEQYLRLLQSIGESGIFHALLVLPDGKVVDGQHRYFCAQELGLESVPVRIIDVALPLGDADQLAIEDWAVYDVITRRHLTKVQATEMLYDLLRGRTEVQARLKRLANLKRGNEKSDIQPDQSYLTVKELAARAGWSERSVKMAVTVVRHAPPEIQAQLRNGRLTLGGAVRAMKAARAEGNDAGEATATPAETPGATLVEAARARTSAAPNGAGRAVTDTVKPAVPRPASAPSAEERSRFADVAEAFVDSAKALVSKARAWNREALEQLSHALGQIETSLRDGGAKAREGNA